MKNLCVDLKFEFPLFTHEQIKEKYKGKHVKIDLASINEKFCKLIKSKNLVINHAQIFYVEPFSNTTIHRDKELLQDFPKMNFVFGGEGSVMQWFEPRPEYIKKIKLTPLGIPYVAYDPDEVKLIHQSSVAQPSIVQAGIPHNIITFSEPRYCFSFIFAREDYSIFTFKDLVSLFDEYKT
jgi:hypothetical protein